MSAISENARDAAGNCGLTDAESLCNLTLTQSVVTAETCCLTCLALLW